MVRKLYFPALLVLLVLLLACTPQSRDVGTPVPTQATPAAGSTSNLPPPTSQDAAWAQVLQAGKKEGHLTVYTVHFWGDMANEITKTFLERTGILVEFIVGGSSATSIERLKAERRVNSQVASVLTGASTLVLLAKQDGLTQKAGDIPEVKDERIYRYDPRLDKDGHMLSLQLITQSPWINTKMVQPGTEPKSWLDLLKPEWRGKIGISDPDTSPSVNYYYYVLSIQGKLDPDYFTKLAKQQLQLQPTIRMEAEALARGLVPLSFSNTPSSNSLMPFLIEGAPLKAVDMAEGIIIYRSGAVSLLQGAPQPNAARVFVNWLFSKEGITIFSKYAGTVGFRKDVPSFIPPEGQLNPANPIIITVEDELEISKIQRERTLSKILRGG